MATGLYRKYLFKNTNVHIKEKKVHFKVFLERLLVWKIRDNDIYLTIIYNI